MADSKYFNFSNFKSVMDVADIDEPSYAFIMRSVFSYVKRKYGIDLDATITSTVDPASTVTSLVVPANTTVAVDQKVVNGTEEVYITSVTQNTLAGTTTITVSPAFTLVPTNITIYTTLNPFELQYALYQHAKFLFESQKKNTQIISTVTDSVGGRTIYKEQPSGVITSVYHEYSPNAIAFI